MNDDTTALHDRIARTEPDLSNRAFAGDRDEPPIDQSRSPVAAAKRVSIADAARNAVEEAEQARNIRHSRMLIAVLETLRENDIGAPRPGDMPKIYSIFALIDEIALDK